MIILHMVVKVNLSCLCVSLVDAHVCLCLQIVANIKTMRERTSSAATLPVSQGQGPEEARLTLLTTTRLK